jgi:hypothetical protein
MKTYTYTWRNKFLTQEAHTMDDMIAALRAAADQLQAMKDAGVTLSDDGRMVDDYAELTTTDRAVAKKYGFR